MLSPSSSPSSLQSYPLHTPDPSQWLKGMPIQNKSHQVNTKSVSRKELGLCPNGCYQPSVSQKGWNRPCTGFLGSCAEKPHFAKQHLVEHLDIQAAQEFAAPTTIPRWIKPHKECRNPLQQRYCQRFGFASIPTCIVLNANAPVSVTSPVQAHMSPSHTHPRVPGADGQG